ncbi:helix-turn-helix transcriptional regulator [Frankia casuarinae]|uniref:helix-turn-helix transcriptional regulator n=1 Tax=Frankia casuarinae (strain DSM 45818 / CECT 9043 / HFP020203 / CcI3) TaxID=106370 RepID=UPI0009F8AE77|nr:helix-turn-helix domain-containing protein [Frankia casuarinae]
MTAGSPDPDLEWWTTSDVAEYLGVRVGTVSSYRIRGQMPEPDRTIGRTHVWRPQRILEWHAGRTRVGVGGRARSGATSAPDEQASGELQTDPESEIGEFEVNSGD